MKLDTLAVATISSLSIAWANLALASSPPCVEYDTPFSVSCIDVTPKGGTIQRESKIVDVRIDVSAVLRSGVENALDEVVYELSTPHLDGEHVISDIAPKTTMYTDVVKPIVIVEESSSTVGGSVDVRGEYKVLATADLKMTSANKAQVQYSKLPPKSLVVASGFMDRHRGVFFKLKPTTQDTLEGNRSFSFLMTVPLDWQADWIDVCCHATGHRSGWWRVPFLDSATECGQARFSVGLYLEGNPKARALAQQMGAAQQAYFDELYRVQKRNSKIVSLLKWLFWSQSTRPGITSGMNEEIAKRIAKNLGLPDWVSPEVKETLGRLDAAKQALAKLRG